MTLTEYVQAVSLEDFGYPFCHEAFWNKRLRSSGGRFFPKDGHLDFNPKFYTQYDLDVFRKIVRHELCHYHLYFAGKGYRHKDADFKKLLAQVEGLRFAPPLSGAKTFHYYQCSKCGQIYQRQRRINLSKYVCRYCHGKLLAKNQS